MRNPFKPKGYQTVNGSLNRVVFNKLKSYNVDEKYIGETSFDLLSNHHFANMIRENATELKVNQLFMDYESVEIMTKLLSSDNEDIAKLANNIVMEYGKRLGILLVTLIRGDENKLKRKGWRQKHWNYFKQLENVYLGGGLMYSPLGEKIIVSANKVIKDAGIHKLKLNIVNNPEKIILNGLAHKVNNEGEKVLLIDFGQTAIKTALSSCTNSKYRFTNEKILSTKILYKNIVGMDKQQVPKDILDTMIFMISFEYVKFKNIYNISNKIGISLATYLDNNTKPICKSIYGDLRYVTSNLEKYMKDKIENEVGEEINLTVMNDSDAAAYPYKNGERTLVLTLGTAIGVSYL